MMAVLSKSRRGRVVIYPLMIVAGYVLAYMYDFIFTGNSSFLIFHNTVAGS
jgi:hypothetical protein